MRSCVVYCVWFVAAAGALVGCQTGNMAGAPAQRTAPYNKIEAVKLSRESSADHSKLGKGQAVAVGRDASGQPFEAVPERALTIQMVSPGAGAVVGQRTGGGEVALGRAGARVERTQAVAGALMASAESMIGSGTGGGAMAMVAQSRQIAAVAREGGMRSETADFAVGAERGGGGLQTRLGDSKARRTEGAGNLGTVSGRLGAKEAKGVAGLATAAGADQIGRRDDSAGLAVAKGSKRAEGESDAGGLAVARGAGQAEGRSDAGAVALARDSRQMAGMALGSGAAGIAHSSGVAGFAIGGGGLSARSRDGVLDLLDRQGVLDALEKLGIPTGRMTLAEADALCREAVMEMGRAPNGVDVWMVFPKSRTLVHGQCFALAIIQRNTGTKPVAAVKLRYAIPENTRFEGFLRPESTDEYQAKWRANKTDGGEAVWKLKGSLEPGKAFVGVVVLRADPWKLFPVGTKGSR
jgi:hypothetical protein